MAKSIVTEAELRRAHRALRIATPFEAMSDLLRATLAAAARAMASRQRQRARRRCATAGTDLKRRAAADFDD